MKRMFLIVTAGLVLAFTLGAPSPVSAVEIMNEKQCNLAVKDTEEAISINPKVGGKAQKILLEIMVLAKQRCQEKQFSNAKQLLDLARGMVASE